ncbi:ATP-dependent helicase HrpB [Vibrio sp. TRT 17S01]|uniref:ATP-dependent helicase HrpB n=1 Tax=Vibrio sp. TRT 17S01 TaxID=3418505 RepID=UPI003CF417D3
MSQLPIEAVMPDLLAGLASHDQLILKAAPGAGKSTFFPLQLLRQNRITGKILMLEPRRLAARNIARYLAEQLGESVGETVGYRVRGDNRVSSQTKLEIVTEGVMTRMLQTDPELHGVGLVIFDEFHERSLHADTALAFVLEVQQALREDLKLVVMSATLDHSALIGLLPDAIYIESQGRSFPVEQRYCPLRPNENLLPALAKQVVNLLHSETGSMLVFLPGVGAIKRLAEQLQAVDETVDICPLYGQLSIKDQQKAIAPTMPGRRKVVLATNIAETSLTIEGIRIVVDSGLERMAKFDLKSGITRIEETRIAQSSAVQRAGRAGRLEAGICVRIYSESQLNQQPLVPQPEVIRSDLSNLALELAQWGCKDAAELQWLDLPPYAALNQARDLLRMLGLMDEQHQLTSLGQQAHALGIEPRLAAMLVKSQHHSWLNTAIAVAALLEEPEKNQTDFSVALHRLKQGNHSRNKLVLQRIQALAAKFQCRFSLESIEETLLGPILCLAFPDRIAGQRHHQPGRYLLANGHGAMLKHDDVLVDEPYLVCAELMRSQTDASTIYLAARLDIVELEQRLPELFSEMETVDWDDKKGRLIAEKRVQIAHLLIQRTALPAPSGEKMTEALLNYVRRKGLAVLHWNTAALSLLERIRCGSDWLNEEAWPAMDEQSLLDTIDEWLLPYMVGVSSVKAMQQLDLCEALLARLGWPLNQQLDEWLPNYYTLPTGSKKQIRYQQGESPVLSVRMQEIFGERSSPVIAKGRQKVVLELLSPAQRPLQVTRDLASFWQGAYKEVQKEMKGRYPKHVWPDDPANHVATTKTKRQLNQ